MCRTPCWKSEVNSDDSSDVSVAGASCPKEIALHMTNTPAVNDILKKEFGRNIGDENVHILDPFTGTGTFITRLLQSGLIEEKDLERKYKHEIHANEIVLLAYYIAAINIENAYHDQTLDPNDGIGKEKYTPFDGIVLTDTFQLGESQDGEKLFFLSFCWGASLLFLFSSLLYR